MYAKFSAIKYDIVFYFSVNQQYVDKKTITVNFDEPYTIPKNLLNIGSDWKLTGYSYYDEKSKRTVNIKEGSVLKNLSDINGSTVYVNANCQYIQPIPATPPIKYSLKYVLNGGKKPKTNISAYWTQSSQSLNSPTKKGYTFTGWYTNISLAGKGYTSTDPNWQGDLTLYAGWKINNYCISFTGLEEASHPYNSDSVSYTIKSKTIKLKKPTRPGYTFKGWYSGNKKVTSIAKGSTGNKVLMAKWTPNKYQIKFDKNKGKGSTKAMTCTYGKTYSLRNNKFTRKGYTFVGWSFNKNGSGRIFTNCEQIQNLTVKKNGTVKLYAQWVKN